MDSVDGCKFCGPRAGCDPADPLHVVEMDRSWTFLDPNQTYRGPVIVVVKGHHEDIGAMPSEEGAALYTEMTRVAGAVRRRPGDAGRRGADRVNGCLVLAGESRFVSLGVRFVRGTRDSANGWSFGRLAV